MKITGLQKKLGSIDPAQALKPFLDASGVASWAKEGVASCVSAKIVTGRTEDTLEGTSFITRAEVAAVIKRLLEKSGLI
ncbi:hypothetical protein D3C76_1744060 [compost metagenome]